MIRKNTSVVISPENVDWIDELRNDERTVYFGMSRSWVARELLKEYKRLIVELGANL